jgi:hypothetical protein
MALGGAPHMARWEQNEWRSESTTMKYIAPDPALLHQAIELLDEARGAGKQAES